MERLPTENENNTNHASNENCGKNVQLISPEIKECAMKKLKYIYEFGTAYTGLNLNGYNRRVMNLAIEKDGVPCFFVKKTNEQNKVEDEFTQISVENVREFLQPARFIEAMKNVFSYGVMGGTDDNMKNGEPSVTKTAEDYRNKIEERKKRTHVSNSGKLIPSTYINNNAKNFPVYFNIVGRSQTQYAHIHHNYPYTQSGITLIFDTPSREEAHFLKTDEKKNKEHLKFGGYSVNSTHTSRLGGVFERYGFDLNSPAIKEEFAKIENDPEKLQELAQNIKRNYPNHMDPYYLPNVGGLYARNIYNAFTNEGLTRTNPDEGFELRNRIPPRKFQGLVLSPPNGFVCMEELINEGEEVSDGELYERFIKFYKDLKDEEKQAKKIHKIFFTALITRIMSEIDKEKPENSIPIYDPEGNLIWPQEISRDEIVETTGAKIDDRDPNYHKAK
ncbi:MAG: hypothetical protein WCO09_00825 [bacterium]